TVVNQYDYDAFGNTRPEKTFETVPNRYRFQGREWDAYAGHYYYRMRTYVPEWGSFTGPDMNLANGIEGESNGLGNYLAMGNDPLRMKDAWGLFSVIENGNKKLVVSSDGTVLSVQRKDASGNWVVIRGMTIVTPSDELTYGDLGMMASEGARGVLETPVALWKGTVATGKGIGKFASDYIDDPYAASQNAVGSLVEAVENLPAGAERLASDPRAVGTAVTMLALPKIGQAVKAEIGLSANGLASGLAGPSIVVPSRAARYAYLKTFKSAAFRNAAEKLGYTSGERNVLRSQLLEWSRNGRIGQELNPLLGGYATSSRFSVGTGRLLFGGRTLRSAVGHELTHGLQEIRYGALTMEESGALTRSQIQFFETEGAIGGTLTIGGTPGWAEEFYGKMASWLNQ
ncbi:MAG: RHS repeat-associated core domain-containing protein, partial [Magnetococcus sp. WYHC-3]